MMTSKEREKVWHELQQIEERALDRLIRETLILEALKMIPVPELSAFRHKPIAATETNGRKKTSVSI